MFLCFNSTPECIISGYEYDSSANRGAVFYSMILLYSTINTLNRTARIFDTSTRPGSHEPMLKLQNDTTVLVAALLITVVDYVCTLYSSKYL